MLHISKISEFDFAVNVSVLGRLSLSRFLLGRLTRAPSIKAF